MPESDDFRDQLIRRIDAYRQSEDRVRQRYEELRTELETMAARRTAAESLFTAEFGDLPDPAEVGPRSLTESDAAKTLEGPLTGMSWIAAITTILEKHGPLHVKDIWQLLQDGGFRTEARDPLRSIVAVAIREPRIVRVGANRYAIGRTDVKEGRLV